MGSIDSLINKTLGQYRLEKLLGYGGMGAVYLSTSERLRRKVAVKVLLPSLILGQLPAGVSFRDRFLDEARVAAMLDEHPNILNIHDFGVQDEIAYLVMQYAPNGTLQDQLNKGLLPLENIRDHLMKAADALDYAHQRGVIHRDIKPHNFLLAGNTLLLSDFGIARLAMSDTTTATNGSAWTLTAEGHQGTPAYMSPEQSQGDQIDHRADVYSLGVTLYQMLCGEVPFKDSRGAWAVIYKHVNTPPPPLVNKMAPVREDVSPTVLEAAESVVMKALAKKPEDRYQSALQLAKAFRRTLGVRCPNPDCRALNRPRAKYCFKDRALLSIPTPRDMDFEDIVGLCLNCAYQNRSGARYCNKCGRKLDLVWP